MLSISVIANVPFLLRDDLEGEFMQSRFVLFRLLIVLLFFHIYQGQVHAQQDIRTRSEQETLGNMPVIPTQDAAQSGVFQEVVNSAIARYPFLDSNSPTKIENAITIVVALRDKFAKEGKDATTALSMAVSQVGPLFTERGLQPTPDGEAVNVSGGTFQEILNSAIARYPFLDSNSPLKNDNAITMVVALRDKFDEEGMDAAAALSMAVSQVGPLFSKQGRRPLTGGKVAYASGDYVKAYNEFKVLANQGDPDAQDRVGFMYAAGKGVPQNNSEAIKWFRKAADQGLDRAQESLGKMYYLGDGVPQSYPRAIELFRKAADQGYVLAQLDMGAMYIGGRGVPQDFSEAVKWFRMAADQGFDVAQHSLGVQYFKGEGVQESRMIALMWFTLAAAQGNADAENKRDLLVQKLPPSQVAEAQRLASEWKPKRGKE
jgi:TPR repeat protein